MSEDTDASAESYCPADSDLVTSTDDTTSTTITNDSLVQEIAAAPAKHTPTTSRSRGVSTMGAAGASFGPRAASTPRSGKDLSHTTRQSSPVSPLYRTSATSAHSVHVAPKISGPPQAASNPPGLDPKEHNNTAKHQDSHAAPTRRLRLGNNPYPGLPEHKFGDHSVITTFVEPSLLIEAVRTVSSSDTDFIRLGIPFVVERRPNFEVDEVTHDMNINSLILAVSSQGAYDTGVKKTATIFGTIAVPLAPAPGERPPRLKIRDFPIRLGDSTTLGVVDDTTLVPWMNGDLPNSKAVQGTLQSILRLANPHLLLSMADSILLMREYKDNVFWYAKVLFYALCINVAEITGTVLTAEAFNAENTVSHINLSDVNLQPTRLRDAVLGGGLVLLMERDYNPEDIQLIHWLANKGRRLSVAEEHRDPAYCHVTWPSTPITTMSWAAATARPAAAVPTANQLIGFASRLAANRGEWDAFQKGMFVAYDLIGMRAVSHNATDYFVHMSNYNAAYLKLPSPCDTNFMLRMMKLTSAYSHHAYEEAADFCASEVQPRVHLACLYSACISAFTTTALYDMNLTSAHLKKWMSNDAILPNVLSLLQGGLCQVAANKNCFTHDIAKKAFKRYIGLSVLQNLYPNTPWNGELGELKDDANVWDSYTANITPSAIHLMVIDDFLIERPHEWGVLGPTTKVDLSADYQSIGAAARVGIYTRVGSQQYSQLLSGRRPYLNVAYGIQVVNAICQNQSIVAGPIKATRALWSYQGQSDWTRAENFDGPVYDADLHIYNPCTVMSYDFEAREVIAPCLLAADLGAPNFRQYASWSGQVMDYVGFLPKQHAPLTASTMSCHPMDDMQDFFSDTSANPTVSTDAGN